MVRHPPGHEARSLFCGMSSVTMATLMLTEPVSQIAVAVALFAEWRAGIRLRDERDHSAKVLAAQQVLHDKEIADERELADERLTRQLEHSAAQLAAERKAAMIVS